MPFDRDLEQPVAESRRRLEALTPDQNLAAARLARQVKPLLASDGQRELAEETAKRFEKRASAYSPRSR